MRTMHHLMRNLPVVGTAAQGARPESRRLLQDPDERVRTRASIAIREIEAETTGRE
jgi:hypothetical protein